MNIRTYYPSDLPKLAEIHQKYYSEEFHIGDFFNHPFAQLVVEENGNIIAAASIREILEIVAITNKDFSPRKRRMALLNILQGCMFTAARTNFNQLHAFIQNDTWQKQLSKYGFKPTKGQALVLNI
jgi:hypothetical protein